MDGTQSASPLQLMLAGRAATVLHDNLLQIAIGTVRRQGRLVKEEELDFVRSGTHAGERLTLALPGSTQEAARVDSLTRAAVLAAMRRI